LDDFVMKLLTFRNGDRLRLGIKTARGVIDVLAANEALGIYGIPDDPIAFLQTGLSALPQMQSLLAQTADTDTWSLDESALELGPCIPFARKIICVGLNYRRHAEEAGMGTPTSPVLFSKFDNAIAAPNEIIPLPSNATQYDYEAELVVVIGKRAHYVDVDKALDYVLGYCTGNDISARELQTRTSQWLLGKTLDKFLPLGPYLATADEVDPTNLPIKCWLNGDLRQDSNTSDMVFSVAEIISYASQYMTLEAGDIISTGTPEGVILGRDPKVWMKPGDEVTVEVGDLGRLTNVMGAERAAQ
jgi:2-keto-4-pentenoate hydratase/2-oxohepta-3-ene-1,7-dioic acid hydratase in catechol pathway